MTIRWYTIQIMANLQQTAIFNLERQNFTSCFPVVITRKSKTEYVTESLFKGYGFVQIDLEVDQWRSVNGTRGVVGLLPKWAFYPHPMPVGFVEYFKENGPIRNDEFEEVFDSFFPGAIVELKDGLLKGKRGTVLSVRNRLLEISFQQKFLDSSGHSLEKHAIWVDKNKTIISVDEIDC